MLNIGGEHEKYYVHAFIFTVILLSLWLRKHYIYFWNSLRQVLVLSLMGFREFGTVELGAFYCDVFDRQSFVTEFTGRAGFFSYEVKLC